MGCVFGIVVLANMWSSEHFFRLDITDDKNHSLDLSTQALAWQLERPLVVKIYFSKNLQAPYNNHEALLIDKIEELRAYSRGWLQIDVVDPTNIKDKEEEAKRFGIQPIEYRFRDNNMAELKKVFMGAVFLYGDKQEVLPAVTQTETLEYDIARVLRALLTDKKSKDTIGFTVGHQEPNLLTGGGPLQALREKLQETYQLQPVELGAAGGISSEIDALWIIGPQESLSNRELYQIDQFLMKGGSVGFFVTNTKADMRSLKPQNLFHGLDPLLGHYGVQLNRDMLVDRVYNGKMSFPVRYGQVVRTVQVNYPLIPNITNIRQDIPVMKGIDSMLFPFSSSVELVDNLPANVTGEIWAKSSDKAGKVRGVMTLEPQAYQQIAPGEETGSWATIVGLTGKWSSYFANTAIPLPDDNSPLDAYEESEKLREGTNARMIVVSSADMVANNALFMLNLADWMVQDEELINIRSKTKRIDTFAMPDASASMQYKLFNLLGGSVVLLLLGLLRKMTRKSKT